MKMRKLSLSGIIPALAWMAVLLYYSTAGAAGTGAPGTVLEDVSFLHVPAYLVLASLLLRASLRTGSGLPAFVAAIAFSAAYGAAMEALQLFTAARLFSVTDMLLNLAGSCLTLAFLEKRARRAPPRRH